MAIDASALASRAAELLTDEEFDFWKLAFHERSVQEALCIIAEMGDTADLSRCMEFETQAGARQRLPDSVGRFVGVVGNVGGMAVQNIEAGALSRLLPCWQMANWSGQVESWTKTCADKLSFDVYPPAPAGHKLQVTYIQKTEDMTADELGCKYQTAIIDYLLWRAYEREGSENGGKWQGYRSSFFDTLGMYKTLDAEKEAKARGLIR